MTGPDGVARFLKKGRPRKATSSPPLQREELARLIGRVAISSDRFSRIVRDAIDLVGGLPWREADRGRATTNPQGRRGTLPPMIAPIVTKRHLVPPGGEDRPGVIVAE